MGSFYTAYAAAVTVALSKTKGLQDERDATLLSGCLTTEQAEQAAKKEDLTLGVNPSLASGFTNVAIQDNGESTLRLFRISTTPYPHSGKVVLQHAVKRHANTPRADTRL